MNAAKGAARPALKVVPGPADGHAASLPTRLQLTRALARAFARKQRAEALLRQAEAEIDAAFTPWAAGRSIDRDTAREQLISTGHLPIRTARA